jgi:regulator of replication initiation timing
MELFDKAGNIELKIRQLAKKMEHIKIENADLKKENQALKEMLLNGNTKIEVIKEKLEDIQRHYNEAQENEENNASPSKEKMMRFFRAIGQCLMWLEKY